MTLTIQHQEKYSRGELLLRTFFGWFYLFLPHALLLFFAGLWGVALWWVAFWVIVLTGRYPESMFAYQLGLIRWTTRVRARLFHLSDGYPAFGTAGTDDRTELDIPYPGQVHRGQTVLRFLLGFFYVVVPHGLVLLFRGIYVFVTGFLAWWAVLFTGQFPRAWHQLVVSQVGWQVRVTAYLLFMTETYPAFSGFGKSVTFAPQTAS